MLHLYVCVTILMDDPNASILMNGGHTKVQNKATGYNEDIKRTVNDTGDNIYDEGQTTD